MFQSEEFRLPSTMFESGTTATSPSPAGNPLQGNSGASTTKHQRVPPSAMCCRKTTTHYSGLRFVDTMMEDYFMGYVWCSRSKVPLAAIVGIFSALTLLFGRGDHWNWLRYFGYPALLLFVVVLLVDIGLKVQDKLKEYPDDEFLSRCRRTERLALIIVFLLITPGVIGHYGFANSCSERHDDWSTKQSSCYRTNVSLLWLASLLIQLVSLRALHFGAIMAWALVCFIVGRFLDPPRHDTHWEVWSKLVMIVPFAVSLFLLQAWKERNSRQAYLLEVAIVFLSHQAHRQRTTIAGIVGTMLPPEVLHRIGNQRDKLRRHDIRIKASFLQFDVVNFTKWCSTRTAEELVQRMSELVLRFDAEVKVIGAEKLKTIGDCYQATSGLLKQQWSVKGQTGLCLFYLANRMHCVLKGDPEQFSDWSGRIGVATGALLGTIVGTAPYRYDAFGGAAAAVGVLEPRSMPEHTLLCPTTTSQVMPTISQSTETPSTILSDGGSLLGYIFRMNPDNRGPSPTDDETDRQEEDPIQNIDELDWSPQSQVHDRSNSITPTKDTDASPTEQKASDTFQGFQHDKSKTSVSMGDVFNPDMLEPDQVRTQSLFSTDEGNPMQNFNHLQQQYVKGTPQSSENTSGTSTPGGQPSPQHQHHPHRQRLFGLHEDEWFLASSPGNSMRFLGSPGNSLRHSTTNRRDTQHVQSNTVRRSIFRYRESSSSGRLDSNSAGRSISSRVGKGFSPHAAGLNRPKPFLGKGSNQSVVVTVSSSSGSGSKGAQSNPLSPNNKQQRQRRQREFSLALSTATLVLLSNVNSDDIGREEELLSLGPGSFSGVTSPSNNVAVGSLNLAEQQQTQPESNASSEKKEQAPEPHQDGIQDTDGDTTEAQAAATEEEVLAFDVQLGHRAALISFVVCSVFYTSCVGSMGFEDVIHTHIPLTVVVMLLALLSVVPVVLTLASHGELYPTVNATYCITTQLAFHFACSFQEGSIVSNNVLYAAAFFAMVRHYMLVGNPLHYRVGICIVTLACQLLIVWVLEEHNTSRPTHTIALLLTGIVAVLSNQASYADAKAQCEQGQIATFSADEATEESRVLEQVVRAIMPEHVVPELLDRFTTQSTAPIIQSLECAGIAFLKFERTINEPAFPTFLGVDEDSTAAGTPHGVASGVEDAENICCILMVVEKVISNFQQLLVIKTVGNVLMVGSCLSAPQQEEREQGLAELMLLPNTLNNALNREVSVSRRSHKEQEEGSAQLQTQHKRVAFGSGTTSPPDVKAILHCGIHYGPVTTAVMGANQLIYDVFGTTVNGASRVLSVGCGNNPKFKGQSTIAVSEASLDVVHVARAMDQTTGNYHDNQGKQPAVSFALPYMWSDPFTIFAKGLGDVSVCTAMIRSRLEEEVDDDDNPYSANGITSTTLLSSSYSGAVPPPPNNGNSSSSVSHTTQSSNVVYENGMRVEQFKLD